MADGFKPIPRVQEGGVSLVSAEYANLIIDLLNAFGNGQIAPIAGVGSLKVSPTSFAIWDFSPLDGRLKRLEQLLYVNGVPSMESRVANIEARLNAASISANGACSGNNITINVSLNI